MTMARQSPAGDVVRACDALVSFHVDDGRGVSEALDGMPVDRMGRALLTVAESLGLGVAQATGKPLAEAVAVIRREMGQDDD